VKFGINSKKKWFLVDSDRNKIDFNRREFEFPGETWRKLRNKNIKKKFYVSCYKSVDQASAHLIWIDLSYVIGAEEPYWNDPPLVNKVHKSIDDLSGFELQLLDKIATLLNKQGLHLKELTVIKETTR